MKREIKFRIWDQYDKKRQKGPNEFLQVGRVFDLCEGCCRNCIIQQFTGLKDKNNQDMYEGDLVRVEYKREYDDVGTVIEASYVGEIVFGKCLISDTSEAPQDMTIGFFIQPLPNESEDRQVGLFPDHNLIDGYVEMEIIGNIFENPELMTK